MLKISSWSAITSLKRSSPRRRDGSPRRAAKCRSDFSKGGRLLAFGRGPYATDAQHVSVEFVHPIIVGKRALPALDLSLLFRPWLDAILRADDIVMGFGPPEGDAEIEDALAMAHARGAMTFALPGSNGSYTLDSPSRNPFLHQELIEILYHTLWETVHVFFEHREMGDDVGASGFLYPFLGEEKQQTGDIVERSRLPSARRLKRTRLCVRRWPTNSRSRSSTPRAPFIERLAQGGKLIVFGNGGSATDANDFAIDCVRHRRDTGRFPRFPCRWSPPISPRSPTMWESS